MGECSRPLHGHLTPSVHKMLWLAGSAGTSAIQSCAASSGTHHTQVPTLPTWSTISVTLKVYPGRHGLHVWRARAHASAEPGLQLRMAPPHFHMPFKCGNVTFACLSTALTDRAS